MPVLVGVASISDTGNPRKINVTLTQGVFCVCVCLFHREMRQSEAREAWVGTRPQLCCLAFAGANFA